jgi:uncharacterized protein
MLKRARAPLPSGIRRLPGVVTGGSSPEDGNMLGEGVEMCSIRPMSGFYGTAAARPAPRTSAPMRCAQVTEEFLTSGLEAGRPLGLRSARWKEALDAGVVPRVILRATDENGVEGLKGRPLLRRGKQGSDDSFLVRQQLGPPGLDRMNAKPQQVLLDAMPAPASPRVGKSPFQMSRCDRRLTTRFFPTMA